MYVNGLCDAVIEKITPSFEKVQKLHGEIFLESQVQCRVHWNGCTYVRNYAYSEVSNKRVTTFILFWDFFPM